MIHESDKRDLQLKSQSPPQTTQMNDLGTQPTEEVAVEMAQFTAKTTNQNTFERQTGKIIRYPA